MHFKMSQNCNNNNNIGNFLNFCHRRREEEVRFQ